MHIKMYLYIYRNQLPIPYQPANQPTSQPASPANQPASPTQPAQPNHHPPSQPDYMVRRSVSYLTKVPIIGGCPRERGSSQKYRVLPLSFYANKRHTNSMKSANFTYKMQFRCRGVARCNCPPQFITVIYLPFRVVEILTFYRRKVYKRTYQKHV